MLTEHTVPMTLGMKKDAIRNITHKTNFSVTKVKLRRNISLAVSVIALLTLVVFSFSGLSEHQFILIQLCAVVTMFISVPICVFTHLNLSRVAPLEKGKWMMYKTNIIGVDTQSSEYIIDGKTASGKTNCIVRLHPTSKLTTVMKEESPQTTLRRGEYYIDSETYQKLRCKDSPIVYVIYNEKNKYIFAEEDCPNASYDGVFGSQS